MSLDPDEISSERLATVLTPIVNAAIRQYFSSLARRYLGIVAVAVAIILIAVLMPTKTQNQSPTGALGSGGTGTAASGSDAGQQSGTDTGSGTGITGAPGAASGASGGPAATATGRAVSKAGGGGASGTLSGGAVGQGVAVNGTQCGPGVKQFSFSVYAPPCRGAWTGNNGGATAHGVTGKTITFVYRKWKECASNSSVFNCDGFIHDIQTWINVFNKNYELYGRQVVLKVFQGQGSAVLELYNQGQAQAQADAQTAYDQGGFAEATIGDYAPWYQALANKEIISNGVFLPGLKNLRDYSPYVYGTMGWPLAENWGNAAVQTACHRMKGMPAIFAGDAVYQRQTRKFGLVTSSDPDWGNAGKLIQSTAAACGITLAATETYDTNTSTQQAPTIVANLRAAGVTTVLTAADTFMTALLQQSANTQNYRPEWIVWEPASFVRDAPNDQVAHSIKLSSVGPNIAPSQEESYKVFQMGGGSGTPATDYAGFMASDQAMYSLMFEFNAIQGAGPNLTAATYRRGYESNPCATGPVYGTFCYSPSTSNQTGSPPADFVFAGYNPNLINPTDGNKGQWVVCNGGTRYKYAVPFGPIANLGTGQLACPIWP